jgi:hypothetical protein
MYRVDHARGRWQVFDICGRVLFTGSRQQVEDWLDLQDNVQQWGTSTGRLECIGKNTRIRLSVDLQIDDGMRTLTRCEPNADLLPDGCFRAGVPDLASIDSM